mgnify:CR=1 FL=1
MIKTDAAIMQDCFQPQEIEVPDERRVFLARKGQLLYGKYCGTKGRGICAESFAEYHVWRGELIVVRDLLVFLHQQRDLLEQEASVNDRSAAQLEITSQLIGRIERLVNEFEPEMILAQSI